MVYFGLSRVWRHHDLEAHVSTVFSKSPQQRLERTDLVVLRAQMLFRSFGAKFDQLCILQVTRCHGILVPTQQEPRRIVHGAKSASLERQYGRNPPGPDANPQKFGETTPKPIYQIVGNTNAIGCVRCSTSAAVSNLFIMVCRKDLLSICQT